MVGYLLRRAKHSERAHPTNAKVIGDFCMDSNFVLYLGRHTLEVALLIAAPILVTCVVVGVLITLLQAVTSIRDMSLTVVPKLIAVGIVTIVFSGWMLDTLLKFVTEVFSHIQTIGH